MPAGLALAQSPYLGQVRHAPSINGNVQGSLQQMLGENVTFNGGAYVTGDLYVLGTPTVQMNGTPTYGGTLQGNGSTTPSNYTITLNTGATLGHVVRRTNAITWPTLPAVTTPTNTASVTVNSAGQSVNWATLRDLTLNSGVGQFAVPAGTYGTFTANNNSGFTLGTAGATTASVYNFQNLNLNSISKLLVVGPVVINVVNGFSPNSTVGASTNPAWLTLNIKSGGLNLNSGCNVYGYVLAPSGTVIINSNAQLLGGVTSDYLTINAGGFLKLQAPQSANQAPAVTLTAPTNGAVFVSPASITLSANASDADGTVAKVEFFRGTTKVGEDTTAPYSITLTGITAGSYAYFARATDNAGATADSATATVTVTNPNQPPTITLTAPANNATFTAPVSVTLSATAADADGTITRVDFYVGTTLIGSDTTAPYQIATSTLSAGTYALSAKAVDNSGAITASATATITVVNPNQAPTVSITAPADGTSYDDPASFAVNATAADADGTVVKVGFYRNGTLQAEDTTAPYTFAAVGLTPGIYDFVARATDNGGSATDSAPVRITVAHINDAPVANAQPVTTNEDTAKPITLTATDPDGDTLSYTVVTGPAHGTLSGTAPALTYTPAGNFNGTDTFTFKVTDPGTLQSPVATVTITVVPVNDPPVAEPKNLVVPENGSGQVQLSGLDIDSASLQFVVSANPAHGTLSGTLPDLTYTPTANYHGPDAFSYTAFDGEFVSSPVQVSITVTPSNVAPVADAAGVATNEDVPVAVTLTGTDADGDPLTYAVASSPTHGTLSGTAPALTYTPAANYHGADSFTFTVSDAGFTSAPATVTLTVLSVNDEPIAQSQSLTTVEDTPLPVVLNAVEIDTEDTLTYSVVTPPAHGTVSGTGANRTYTPSANYHGHDSFTFKANDGTADSAPATVSIEITPFNDRPFAGDLEVNAVEDVPAAFDLPAVDVDADSLTYTIITPPAHGTLSGTAPHLVYTPVANYHGDDGFTYKVSDGSLESAPGLVTFAIAPVNDAPEGASITVPLDEDTTAAFVLPGSDVDGDAITYTIIGGPQHGVLSGTAPNLVYTPAPNYNGSDSLTYSVKDGTLTAGPYTITFAVAPVNDAPVADPKSMATDEDTPASVTLTGSDIDGDSLTFTIATPPAHGSLQQVSVGTFTYTPAPNYNGPDGFTYVANDATTSSAPAAVTIAIAPVNDAPIAVGQSVQTPEDTAVVITLAGFDVDGDSLTYAITANPAHGTLTPVTTNTYSYLPAQDYHGPDTFEFTTSDHQLTSAPVVVTLDVTPVNDAPVAVDQAFTTNEDEALPLVLAASDVDGDALNYTVQAAPAHGILSGSAPNLIYTPAADYHGTDTFTFTASDGQLSTAVTTVTLTIISVNDAPVASGQSVTTAEDTAKPITLAATDVDGDALTYVVTTLPAHGTLSGSAPALTYTPAADFNGSDSFQFIASDGTLSSAQTPVLITITPVNDAPVATANTYATTTGAATPVVLTGTDVDGDALTFVVLTQPARGTLTGTPPNLVYTSAPDFGGFDSFTFRANDGSLNSNPATIQLTAGLAPRSRTYTTTADFSSGALTALSTDVPDQVSNKVVLASFDAVWVANSSKGTVVKIDPDTGRVTAEFKTKPDSDPTSPYPSRVAVDSKGNAWIANYSHNSLVKIGLPESGGWVDRNNNGQIDTSGGLGDIRNWAADGIANATDEAILLYIRTDVSGVRQLSIDKDDNVWVGGPGGLWQKFDGQTGALLRDEPSLGLAGQGGFITRDGKMYSTGSDYLIWQTSSSVAPLPESDGIRQNTWASALDSKGNLWVTKDGVSTVIKYAPDGTVIGEYFHGAPWAMGIAIDDNDHVWIAHSHCGHTVGHMLPDGTLLGTVEVVNHGPVEVSVDHHGRVWVVSSTGVVERIDPNDGPFGVDNQTRVGRVNLTTGNLGGALWTYGKFVGGSSSLTSPDGLWTTVYDGVLQGTTWGPVVWNALLSNDGQVKVEAALSSDGVTYGPFQPLTLASPTPAGAGRFLKVRSRLVSATTGEFTVLRDLTVGTAGYTPPSVNQFWDVTAGEDIRGNWPDVIQLKGVFRHSVHEFTSQPTYAWTKVSVPPGGDVTFDHPDSLRPKAVFLTKGDYVLRLTATLDGVTVTDDIKVSLTPYNRVPTVNAGYTIFRADVPAELWLWGDVRDDGLPLPATLTSQWQKLFGPGNVTFTDASSPTTKASFSAPGVYVLGLTGTDGETTGTDVTTVWLGFSCIPLAPDGLVAWWQASGNGDDHIGGNQAFTEKGTDYAEGKLGGAFRFDGINDRVRIFASPGIDTGKDDGFTVELWANPDTSRTSTLLEYSSGAQRGFSIRQLGSRIEADFRSATGTSHVLAVDTVLPVATWTYITASYNKTTGEARLYINGVERVSQSIGSFTLGTNYDLNFGGRLGSVESFDGLLDEVSVYNRALYTDEIWAIFAHPAGKRPPVANVPPRIDVGLTLFDKTANTPVALNGSVVDDGQPVGGLLTSHWSKLSGPGNVSFVDAASPQTTATFSESGVYLLELEADDGGFCSRATLEVRVDALHKVESGGSIAAWWPFNQDTKDVIHGHRVEFSNGATLVTDGKVSRAMYFDGVDDYARVAGHADLDIGAASNAAGLTIELWVRPDRFSGGNPSLFKWVRGDGTGGVELTGEGNMQRPYLRLRDLAGAEYVIDMGFVLSSPGTWAHLAFTYNKVTGVGRGYKDGTMIVETNLGAGRTFRTSPNYALWIGSRPDNMAFKGAIDELTLYNRPLGYAEVHDIYTAGNIGKSPFDDNAPPSVNAGPDQVVQGIANPVTLQGSVTDDGRPAGGTLSVSWSKQDGPGTVTFGNPYAAATTATFSAPGIYVLQLDANDGLNQAAGDAVTISVGVTGANEPTPIPPLAVWWPGDGHPHEIVKGGHDVELVNGSGYVPGKVSEAFYFDGDNDSARVTGHTDLDIGAASNPAGLTIELWLRPDRFSGGNPSLLKWLRPSDGAAGVELTGEGNMQRPYLRLRDLTGAEYVIDMSFALTSTGTWVHLAFTYNKVTGIGRGYKNGTLIIETNLGAGRTFRTSSDYNLWIGSRPENTAFKGAMDEITLYSRPLSQTEIQAVVTADNYGKTPPDDNLPPVVSAGPDLLVQGIGTAASLAGTVTDDNKPFGPPSIQWTKEDGPGSVTFDDAAAAATNATFSAPGLYLLKLTAHDAYTQPVSDLVQVRVGIVGAAEPSPGLAVWWPGDGHPREVLKGGHDVELVNGAGYVPGKVSEAFYFDGDNDFARVVGHADLDIGAASNTAGLTIEFWLRPDRFAGGNPSLLKWLRASDNAAGVEVTGEGNMQRPYLRLRDLTGAEYVIDMSFVVTSPGTWVHLAFTYDKVTGMGRGYKNGTMVIETNLGAGRTFRTSSDYTLWIGSRPENTAFKGALDEISLYSRPLSQTEIQAVVIADSKGKTPPDDNLPPVVSAGPDVLVAGIGSAASLAGSVIDDNKPFGPPSIQWTKEDGPGTVTFGDDTVAATTATFSSPGIYLLKLTATDGLTQPASDLMQVRVGIVGSAEPAPGLAAWWPGDGHPREAVKGGHDVELVNGTTYVPGKVSEAFYFDGDNDFARVIGHADLDIGAASNTAGLTIEFWLRPDRFAGGNPSLLKWLRASDNAAGVEVTGEGNMQRPYLRLRDLTGAEYVIDMSFVVTTPGTWVHLAFTYNKVTGIGRGYKNGTMVIETNLGAGRTFRTSSDYTLWIGSRPENTAFKGALDEITLYSRPLSQEEIQAVVTADIDGKTPPDDNLPPVVSAGPDLSVAGIGSAASLAGTVIDDNKPFGPPAVKWTKEDGPGTVTFGDDTVAATTATFSAAGIYLLKLTAHDAYTQPVSDLVQVRVGVTGSVGPAADVAVWWPGDGHPREVLKGGHDVELVNGAGYVPGKVSEAFYFDGDNDFARVVGHADLDIGAASNTAGLTIEFWLRPDRFAGGNPSLLKWLRASDSAAGVEVTGEGNMQRPYLRLRDLTGAEYVIDMSFVVTSPGTWVHLAFTYDKVTGVGRGYKNGTVVVDVNLGAGRTFRTSSDYTLWIGSRPENMLFKGALDEITLYSRPLSQTEIQAVVTADGAGKNPPVQNIPPTVFLDTPASNSSIVANTALTLSALASDSDGTIAKVEFFEGAAKLGEATAPDSGQPSRYSYALPAGLALGSHVLKAVATDNSGAVSTSAPATVLAVPVLPVVTLTAPLAGATLAAGAPLVFQATATYSAGAITKVEFFSDFAKVGEATTPVSGDTYEFTAATGLTAGAHTLKARVTVAGGVTANSANVNVVAQVVLPVVAITSPTNGSTLVAAVPIALKATATTAQGTITKVEFFDGTTKLGERTAPDVVGGSLYTFTRTAGFTTGAHALKAKATSSIAATATSTVVAVTAGAYTALPMVEIIAPAEDGRISAPTAVTGVVGVPSLTSWVLDYRLKVADGDPVEPWVQFATGSNLVGTAKTSTTAAIPGPLGTFDPTLLLNGIYEIRLRATDASLTTTTAGPITVLVEGNLKVGEFTLAFEDLKVPLAGVPITITRTYDSRDARVGDFGPGWRLAVANIRVQKNRNLGKDWYQTPQSGSGIQFYDVDPLAQPMVTVVMPDGETHRFRGGAYVKKRPGDPDNASFAVVNVEGRYKFYPIGDTTSTLEPVDANGVLDDHFYIHGTGDQDLVTDDASNPFAPIYNPTRFRLTAKDGTRYLLEEKLGLVRLEDLDGNTLVLNRDAQNRVNSVVSTQAAPSGPVVSTVTVHRDGTGRIDYIRDLAGKDLDYLYDSQGRLASFANRENNTTQFRYESPSFPNYLTKIIDPRGIAALRSEYDADGRLVKQIDADGKETVFTRGINAGVRFEKVADRLGQETTYYYDDRGNVTSKIDPLGAQTSYGYYPDSDRVKFETDHYGNVKAMAYDARGNVTVEILGASAAEDPATATSGYITRTSYTDFGAPTQITDPDGRVQTSTYAPASNNLLVRTIGVGGPAPAATTYSYNADGTVATMTDAIGNVTSYSYNQGFSDANFPGAVKEVTETLTDPAGAAGSDYANASATLLRTTRTLYDAQENMVAQIVPRTLPQGGIEDMVTRYFYDAENRLKATVMPDGKVSETNHTSFGQPANSVLWQSLAEYQSGNYSLARVTSYGYDSRGNLTTVTQPDGSYELRSYDAENRLEWSEDANRNRIWFAYDAMGRPTRTYRPDASPVVATDGPWAEVIYDLIGRVRYEIDEIGNLVEYTYDNNCGCAMRRKSMVRHLQSGNEVTFFDYDKAGNLTTLTDPRGNTTTTDYDEHGRQTVVHLPATDEHPATQFTTAYNALGQRIAATDQEGKVTRYRHDGLGRLVETRQYLDQSLAAGDSAFNQQPSTSGVVSTRFSYDEVGNQLTQTDARDNTTGYQYDSVGRRTRRTLPDGAFETVQYDSWGNPWKRTDFKGHTTTFLYDTLNRLTEKRADPTHPSLIYSHAPDKITYGYDAAGNRTDALVEKGTTVLYAENTPVDERGRRKFKDTAYGKLTYGYQANGLLKAITSSNSDGVKLGYRYDGANRLAFLDDTSAGAKTTAYTYNANGSVATVTLPNTVVHAYSYDALDRLRALNVAKGGTSLHAYEYKLRSSGRRQQVIENGSRITTFAYDGLYRLTGETVAGDTRGNNGSVGYTLDKVGNRESRASSVPFVPAAANSFNSRDWLSGDTFDANGNALTSAQAAVSTPDVYDFEDRLIVRCKADGSTVNFGYDADGIMRQKTVFNAAAILVSATGYLTDSQNPTGHAQVMEERINTSAGTTLKTYAYGSDLVSQSTLTPNSALPALRYFSYDGLGSVRELTSETGAVIDRYDYDAFGILIYSSAPVSNLATDYLYRGERFDGDLGQYYLRARFYNQATGRFWNQDTYEGSLDEPASLHKYLYANADPVMLADPSGESPSADVTFASTIQGIMQGGAQVTVRLVARKAGCFAIEYAVEEAVGRGIYIFIDKYGTYVGKSVNVERRLAQHADRVKQLLAKIKVVGVSKKQLGQIEQFVLDQVRRALGVGRNALRADKVGISNKINPVREFLRKVVKIC